MTYGLLSQLGSLFPIPVYFIVQIVVPLPNLVVTKGPVCLFFSSDITVKHKNKPFFLTDEVDQNTNLDRDMNLLKCRRLNINSFSVQAGDEIHLLFHKKKLVMHPEMMWYKQQT